MFVACLMVAMFTASGEAAERQFLKSHVSAILAHLQAVDRLPTSQRLDLAIGLPLRNKEVLNTLIQELYDPKNPNYHHYLTPEQFTERFGPSPADYETVIKFAETNGLSVIATHSNRMLVDVEGSVSDIERTFHVTLRVYRHPTENRMFYAPDAAPSLDLTVPVLDVSGIDNYDLPHPMNLKLAPAGKKMQATPAAGSGPSGTYWGNDFRAAYAPGVALTGSGQKIGLFELDGYYVKDITNYESEAGLPDVNVEDILIDRATGPDSNANAIAEVSLDIEMAIAMAPGVANVIVYEGPGKNTTLANVDDVLNRMATDNSAKQLSTSWSWGGGTNATTDQIFLEYATQGQSFFAASGDSGAYTGTINEPCDDPYITLVGGTTLTTTGPGGSWVSETTWSWFPGQADASSGGSSTLFSIPSWQKPVSMASNQGSGTMRNLPDVALTADNILVIYDQGQSGNYGGTSCAAPLWAGFMALINQRAVAGKQSTIGFVNPAIYTIGLGANYTADFHDITTGNNTNTSSPGNFYATNGYDLCTGWGTPNGTNLIGALTPGASQIMPVLVWTNPAAAGYGTALGSAQLNASANISGTFAYSPSTGTVLNAGTNTLSVIFIPNDTFDYSNATSTVNLVVSPAPLAVTANNDGKVYGQAKSYGSGLTAFTSRGLQNGDTIGTVTITASGGTAANAPVGVYNLTPGAATGGTFLANNYAITYDHGILTVGSAPVSVSGLVVNNKVYDGTTMATLNLGGATLVGVLNGDSVGLGGTPVATFNSAGAGNGITVTVSGLALAGAAAGNYTLTPPAGFTANITAAPLGVSAGNQSRPYGTTNPVFAVSYSGFVNGETPATALTGAPSLTTGATTNSGVGNYVITNSVGTLSASNYVFGFTNGMLSVTNALLTVTANNTNKLYGQPLTFAGTELTVSGLVSTDFVSSAALNSAGASAAAPVGSYAISVTNATGDSGLTNYLATYVPGTLTVNLGTPIPQTVPVASTITFGQIIADSTVTGAVFTNLAGVTVIMSATNFVSPGIAPNAGTTNVLVYFTPVDNADYNPVTNTVKVTVNKGIPIVQTAPAASAISYGQTLASSTVAGGVFTNLAGVMVTMAGANFVSPALTPSAGTTNVLVYFAPVDTANYNPITNTVTVTVNTAALEVSVNNTSREYGSTNPVFTVSYSGFVNGDGPDGLGGTPGLNCGADTNSPVGNYVIAASGLTSTNYAISYTNGVLSVTNALLTVTANNTNKLYGQSLAFAGTELTVSGLVSTDFVSSATLNSPGAAVAAAAGPYPIDVTNAFGDPGLTNYLITYVPGVLTVGTASLGVSVNNTNREYGSTNPVFTVSYSGFVNGDGPDGLGGTLGLNCGADTNSPVGNYVIAASGLTSTNYAISYTNGVLSVTNALLTVTANNTNKLYGQSLAFAGTELTVSGLVSTDFVSSATLASAGTTVTAAAGPYAISVTNALGDTGLTNYLITYVPGVLTVGTASLGVSVNNTSREYGSTNPVFTVSYSGFVNGDGPDGLGGTLGLNCGADTNSPVGNYVIAASGLTSTNYAISYTNGVLSVTNALLTVTANSVVVIYGQTNWVLTGTMAGLENNDNITAVYSTPATGASSPGIYPIIPALVDPADLETNYEVNLVNGVLTIVALPVFQTVAQQGGAIVFTWSATVGQTYQVQYETNLTQNRWINLGNVVTATNNTATISDTNTFPAFPQKFYQILLMP